MGEGAVRISLFFVWVVSVKFARILQPPRNGRNHILDIGVGASRPTEVKVPGGLI